MAMIYANILDTAGNTPIVGLHNLGRLHQLDAAGIKLYAKVEARNPMGSVKDRIAIAMIRAAERSGLLHPGQTVVEATSGNTGIALAMACAVRGYSFVAVMADSSSLERRHLIHHLGGRIVLTPAAAGTAYTVQVAADLAARHQWYCPRQFENTNNPRCHARGTGREIVTDFAHQRLDYFVCGYGTGGTFSGIGHCLRQARPEVRLVAAEPARAPLLSGGHWQPHHIYGWAGDFIPAVMDCALADTVVQVSEAEAIATARQLARHEGICCGISSGAAAAAALKVARGAPAGAAILTLFPDHGERYLSTGLFDHATDTCIETTMDQPSAQAIQTSPATIAARSA